MTTTSTLQQGTLVFWSLSRGSSWYRGEVIFDDGVDVHVRNVQAVNEDIRQASPQQIESADHFPWKSSDLVDPCFSTDCDISRKQACTASEVPQR